MVIDIELTLNRFDCEYIAPNKFQFGCFRVAWWGENDIDYKHAISFEVNWRKEDDH